MKAFISAVTAVIWLVRASALWGSDQPLPTPPPVIVCSDAGAGGYEAFPDVCRLQDGRLIIVFYAGESHISSPNPQLPQGGRIAMTVSTDEGATWSAAEVVFDGPHDDRDPSLCQLANGGLVCTFFMAPNLGTYAIWSDDGGENWSPPQRIASLYNVSSPIRALRTPGRLALGLYAENPANGIASGAVALSDDSGKSWHRIVNLDNAGKYLDAETDLIELRDGILYAIHRGGQGAPMHFTTSADQGLNWGRTKPLDFIGHCPYLLRADDRIVMLAYRGQQAGEWRTMLRYSLDECRTWTEPVLVDNVGGAYPSIAQLADGSFLIVYYEEGKESNIRARRFRIQRLGVEWLAVGKLDSDRQPRPQ